ncbi:MAG: (d)CMP kinase [Bacteroidota bacterium]
MKKITIAIDGHSSCGKSTLAKDMANRLGYAYIDTGAMYRAFTLYCLRNKIIADENININKIDEALKNINIFFRHNPDTNISETYLNGENIENAIRQMPVSEIVSKISEIKEVRQKMVSIQQEMGKKKGVVMEGRDIGTVVFPNAEMKFFMTADIDVRAKRRYEELIAKGLDVTFNQVKKNLQKRDEKDSHREESPLVQAKDAIVLDSTNINQQQQLEFALKLVDSLIG